MPTQPCKRPRDPNQLAKSIVEVATGQVDEGVAQSKKTVATKQSGKIGGRARATALTPEQRSEIARVAAQARWKKL